MTEQPDPIAELADLARTVLVHHCRAVDMALPDDPDTVFRPMVEAVLDEAASQAWIEKQLAETGIRAMDFRNGAEMELEPARELVAHWVAAARTMLGDAPNYTETKVSMDVKVAESPELYTFVVQRHAPGVLTPHEARQKAEQQRDEVLRIVLDYVIESNDVGGLDANDLVDRLEQAGYPLPETDEEPS
ncbi:hypothetical protein [Streptomyces flavidovirens]|uniref:hypothetical protein n=1 Tax=Streptomyces flavidovirens TaxID=67298 RepID=UPI0004189BC0|nr:hypothetical protein [Streptomyces flavidovirens]